MQKEEKVFRILIFLNVLVLSMEPDYIAFSLALLFIFFIVFIARKKIIISRSNLTAFVFLSVTFWVGLAGLINTENIPEGLLDLSRSLPLVILPLILIPLSSFLSKRTLTNALLLFAAGVLIKLFELFIIALVNYFETNQTSFFFYTGLFRQTNSFSYYLAVSYFIFYFLFSDNDLTRKFVPSQRQVSIIEVIILLVVTIGIVFLQSKGVILSFIIVNIVFILIQIRKKHVNSLIISLSACLILFTTTGLKDRFQNFFSDSKQMISSTDTPSVVMDSSFSSTPLRYHALVSTFKLIRENTLFGVGTGDVIDKLRNEYISEKFYGNYKEATAPHNQFLRSFAKNGLGGILALLIYFIFSFGTSLIQKNNLYLAFTLIIFLCCFSNDLFDSGGGAPLIGFMGTLFFISSRKTSDPEPGLP